MSAAKPPAKIPAKPSKDTVYVDIEDEITAIIDKVENAKQKIVALVLPKRATALQSIVNMRLLKRNAEKAAKHVVLITNEDVIIPLAGAVGLHVAKNLQSKPEVPVAPSGIAKPAGKKVDLPEDEADDPDASDAKLDYHRSIGELATEHAGDDEAIDLDDGTQEDSKQSKPDKKPKNKALKIPNFDRFRMMIGLGIAAFILLIVFLVLAFTVLPKATITIHTESIPIQANFTLNTSDTAKALDEANHAIPAASKTSDQTVTQQIQATGQQNNGTPATGTMKITNCSSDVYTLANGTGFSNGGFTFIAQSAVSVPKSTYSFTSGGFVCDNNGTASVAVKAQKGGKNYNISARSYTIAGSPTNVTASGSDMGGGTDDIVTVVSQSDLDSAKSKVTSQSTDAFTKTFEDTQAKAGLYVLTSTLKLSDPNVTSSPAVGQPASNTTVTIKITYTVLTVQKADLTKALTDELNKQVNKAKQKISDTDVLNGATVSVQNQSSPTVATLSIAKSSTAVPIIDIPGVQKQVGGQKSGDIRSALSGTPGVKSVDVKMSPFWVSKAPKKPSHIKVVLVQVKGQGNAAP